MSTIPNSLSRQFPRISLEQGRMRAGLQTGLSRAELAAGKPLQKRFSFQTWGTDAEGARGAKTDSFINGDVSYEFPDAPLRDGWRREFALGLCDTDQRNNLAVSLEKADNSPAQLVIQNPGETSNALLKVAIDGLDARETGTQFLSGDHTRVVFVESDINPVSGDRRTRLGVGTWADTATWYQVSDGTLQICEH